MYKGRFITLSSVMDGNFDESFGFSTEILVLTVEINFIVLLERYF